MCSHQIQHCDCMHTYKSDMGMFALAKSGREREGPREITDVQSPMYAANFNRQYPI